MNTRHRLFSTAITGLMLMLPAWASANTVTIVNDTFDDGHYTAPPRTDPLLLNWTPYTSNTLSVAADSVFGGSDALKISAGNYGYADALLPSTVNLVNIGDTITLAFDFHFTGSISNVASAFRIGLLDHASDADGSSYFAALGSGTNKTALLYHNNIAGISGSATNLSGVQSYSGINDTAKHTASLSVTRTAAGVDIAIQIDGGTANVASEAAAADITSFDGLRIGFGPENPLTIGLGLDNVVVTYATAIPTPAALPAGLALLGLVGLNARRRA